MYLNRIRNFAVSLGGDPQEFLYETLQEAIQDALVTVSAGPNRVGVVVEHIPNTLVQPEDVLLSFWSGNGEAVRFTDYRQLDVEKRFGVLSQDFPLEAERLAGPL